MRVFLSLSSVVPSWSLWLIAGIACSLLLWEARRTKVGAGLLVACVLAGVVAVPLIIVPCEYVWPFCGWVLP